MTATASLEVVRAALPADRYLDATSEERGHPGYRLAGGLLPSIAVRPRTAEEVALVLEAARVVGAAVVPLGAHTAMTLGRPPARYDVALDMLGLDRVIEYEPADLTVTVEAGVTLRDLQARLREHGQYLPVDPSPGDEVTIGGLLATARSGAWRGHLPAARDLILGLTVALPDGSLATSGGRVVKNVTGYDLHRLHTGALGALGVIVRASFKVSPLPEATATLAVRCSNLAVAETVAFDAWHRRLPLRALSILDAGTAAALGLPPAACVLIEVEGVPAAVERASREIGELARARDGAALLELADIAEGPGWRAYVVVDGRSRPATNVPPDWVWDHLRRHADRDDWADHALLRLGVPPSEVRATLEAIAAIGLEGWAHLAAGSVLALGEVTNVSTIEALRAHAGRIGGFLQVESPTAALDGVIEPFGAGDVELTRALKAAFESHGRNQPRPLGREGCERVTTDLHEHEHRGFTGADTPALSDVRNCIHCGFCLPACPTYLATGSELESPRGRLHLIGAVLEARIEANERVLPHLDLCLQCRACETACPSNVPYGRIMEDARAAIVAQGLATRPREWTLRMALLRGMIARPRVLRAGLALPRMAARLGLHRLARPALQRWLPARAASIEVLTGALRRRPFRRSGVLARPATTRARVALLTGCVHGELTPAMHESTVRVLARLGCEVVAPPAAGCCGALHAHAGDVEAARALARRNIEAFEAAGIDAVITNAAGCGAAMKEYGRLLRHDDAWRDRAERFASTVRDVLEYIAGSEGFEHGLGALKGVVTVQDSCHLAHAQGIREAPRRLLAAIPDLELRELRTPDRCCGAAGLYSLVHPAMSQAVLEAKMDDVAGTGAGVVCTSNPGCTLQLAAGIVARGLEARAVHVVELLDESYRAGARGA